MIRAGNYCLSLLLLLWICAPAAARTPSASPEGEVRSIVARWYEELGKKEDGRLWSLTAPGFIDASPHYRYADTGAAKLGPRQFTSLAAQALKFTYEIEAIRLDSSFAKLRVWERGYFFAAAAQQTYERAAATVFVLERQEKDGRWLILAHESSSQGIPPNKITRPMPDLRDLYYATEGKDRDPAKDAQAARKF